MIVSTFYMQGSVWVVREEVKKTENHWLRFWADILPITFAASNDALRGTENLNVQTQDFPAIQAIYSYCVFCQKFLGWL